MHLGVYVAIRGSKITLASRLALRGPLVLRGTKRYRESQQEKKIYPLFSVSELTYQLGKDPDKISLKFNSHSRENGKFKSFDLQPRNTSEEI